METFLINEHNKNLWDKSFIKVEGNDEVQTCDNNGNWVKAEPLNNDPQIQEYGAVTDLLKYGYLNKDYKIFQMNSSEAICFISKEPLKIYDVILFINGREENCGFGVFLGKTEDNTKFIFKYFHSGSDSIKIYSQEIKTSE